MLRLTDLKAEIKYHLVKYMSIPVVKKTPCITPLTIYDASSKQPYNKLDELYFLQVPVWVAPGSSRGPGYK